MSNRSNLYVSTTHVNKVITKITVTQIVIIFSYAFVVESKDTVHTTTLYGHGDVIHCRSIH